VPGPRRAASAAADDPDRYAALGEHARGGLGRVVRALDRRLGRTVAVKELLRHDAATEARFLREAMITARLEHPGIVPVHEAGRWPSGDPYYVMKLVEGRTLKELIGERAALRERLALLPHVIAVADAVGYAHSEGVIHRDLKPSNVIVGAFGETIVVDWGLARDRKRPAREPGAEGDSQASAGSCALPGPARSGATTVSGKVVGTPSLAPEQARGDAVDERADVYALGTVLYELLAGSPPHHDRTPQATLERVLAGPPRPLPALVPQAPRELATIVAKAMARDPADRYENASLLAEDLRRFHTGKLVSAHAYTAWSRLRKKVASHRSVVAVAAASALALGAVGVTSFERVVAERNNAQRLQEQSEARQRDLVLLQAETALRKDPTAALAWLKEYPVSAAAGEPERARVVSVIDEALALGVADHVFRAGDWVFDAALTPDGRTVVAAVRDGAVRAYDLATGAARDLGRMSSPPAALAMAPGGRFVVTAARLGQVVVWPLDGGAARVLLADSPPGAPLWVTDLKLSADATELLVLRASAPPLAVTIATGAQRALAARGGAAAAPHVVADQEWGRRLTLERLTDVLALDGDERRLLARLPVPVRWMSMSPRGDQVLLHDGETVWIVPFSGGELRRLVAYPGKLAQAAWSPDERTVALGGTAHELVLVEPDTGVARELRGHTDANYSLQWSRDGARLLSASDDTTARIWMLADGSSRVLRGHDDDVQRAKFSADESRVVTTSLDGSVRVWAVRPLGTRALLEGSAIAELRLDGARALVRSARELAWWDLRAGERAAAFSWAEDPAVGSVTAAPNGAHLFVPRTDGTGELRHRDGTGAILRGHRDPITFAVFSPDSATLYTASREGAIWRWEVATGQGRLVFDRRGRLREVAVARDGRVAFAHDEVMYLLDPNGGLRELGRGSAWAASAQFDPLHDRLLLRRFDRRGAAVVMHDRLIELSADAFDVHRFAVSPDGRRIAGAVDDRSIRIWDAATGQLIETLRGHDDQVNEVRFSPDGQLLASASYDRTARVWALGTGRSRVLRGHGASVDHIEWQAQHQLVTGSRDGTVRIWDAPSLVLPSGLDLAEQLRRATSATIRGDRPTTEARSAAAAGLAKSRSGGSGAHGTLGSLGADASPGRA
jgi:WD40 repeat protein